MGKKQTPGPKKVVIHIDLSQKNCRNMLSGILKYAYEHTNWIIHRTPLLYRKSANFKEMLLDLYDWEPDGIIMDCGDFPYDIYNTGTPLIVGANVRNTPKEAYHLADNSEAIAQMASEYLFSQRFRKFAYCGLDQDWSYTRGEAFAKQVRAAGFDISVFSHVQKTKDYSWKQEQDGLINWLKSLEFPVALFACNDDRAEEIITICKVIGLRIPDDVAILGVDNDNLLCETIAPTLSSIAFNSENSGHRMAETLDNLMNGVKVDQKVIMTRPTHIATRQSTEITAVDDYFVSEALKFIHDNYTKFIQVQDVADFVGTSDGELRRRFKNKLNRSIQYELTRCRVDFISKMLVETDLSISQIATKLGYPPQGKYIARFFKKTTGMTPFEYKRRYKKIH